MMREKGRVRPQRHKWGMLRMMFCWLCIDIEVVDGVWVLVPRRSRYTSFYPYFIFLFVKAP